MTTLQFAVTMALTAAMVCAVLMAGRDRAHRPIAALLIGWMGANLAILTLKTLIVEPAVIAAGGDPVQGIAPPVPLTGWDRVAAHLGHAIEFGSSAWLAVCAIWVFWHPAGERREERVVRRSFGHGIVVDTVESVKVTDWGRRRLAVCACVNVWLGMAVFFAATYPASRPYHRLGYLLADMLAVAAGAAAGVGWFRRRDKNEGMPEPQKCMLLVLGTVALAIVGAHTVPGYFAGGDRAQAAYGVMYAMLIVYQGGSLWMSKMWSS